MESPLGCDGIDAERLYGARRLVVKPGARAARPLRAASTVLAVGAKTRQRSAAMTPQPPRSGGGPPALPRICLMRFSACIVADGGFRHATTHPARAAVVARRAHHAHRPRTPPFG